ncbi:uncharacterized protein APUU_20070S [Aspergillus puulaauensis]|uniref:Uncharacterized protein n=1 Tax=Aspergillus puulaauensis TaxID=1220207 RepID=A0A7R7XEM8_9EURO|nr:uncharacterized protein APUU_20070S [Aspergillus puulaauensis]BCS19638.1 hypothetical protein APUU_20070S [Aspergillus puulaauensis]
MPKRNREPRPQHVLSVTEGRILTPTELRDDSNLEVRYGVIYGLLGISTSPAKFLLEDSKRTLPKFRNQCRWDRTNGHIEVDGQAVLAPMRRDE